MLFLSAASVRNMLSIWTFCRRCKHEPPDHISNSDVKLLSADGSVVPAHVKVGHRHTLMPKNPIRDGRGFFAYDKNFRCIQG